MMRAIIAAPVYFLFVFAAGFALGAIRVLVLEPRLGSFAATAAETPVMLSISWIAAAWTIRRFRVPVTTPARLSMGAAALVLLLAAEALLGIALGRGFAEQARALGAPAGMLGFAAQLAFAFMPLAQARLSGRA